MLLSAPPEAAMSSLPPAGGAKVKHGQCVTVYSLPLLADQSKAVSLLGVLESYIFTNKKMQKEVV